MGFFRVATRSIISATRSRRRLLVFVTIFTILAAATLFSVGVFEEYSKEKLLDQKGAVISMFDFDSVSYSNASDLLEEVEDEAENSLDKALIYPHFETSPELRVLCIYVNYPWAFRSLNPSDIDTGRFPRSRFEALIPTNARATIGNHNLSLDIGVIVHADSGDDALKIPIVGTFNESILRELNEPQQWIIVGIKDENDREAVRDAFGIVNDSAVYVYQMSFLAKGSPVGYNPLDWTSTQTYKHVETIAQAIKNFYKVPAHGVWQEDIYFKTADEKVSERTADVTRFVFGIGGGILVASLYAYLITRFRRREVAILKAIGYNAMQVRTVLLSEILAVAIGGFIIGYAAVVTGGFIISGGETIRFMSVSTTIISLLAVVLINVPGFLLVSRRILSVRPMELFRGR